MKRTRNHSLLITFSIVFIVTAIISALCFITYHKVNTLLKKIAISESEQYLAQASETISTSFHNTWRVFTDSATFNSYVDLFSANTTTAMMHGTLLSLSKELSRHFYMDNFIHDVGLFISDGENDYLCTTKIISHDFRTDYENGLYSFDDMSYDSYRNMILTSIDNRIVRQNFFVGNVTSKYSNSYSCQVIYLFYPVLNNPNSLQVYAVMQLNLDRIQELLTDFPYSGTYFGLYANNNVPIYTTVDYVTFSKSEQKLYLRDHSASYYVQDFISDLGLTCYVSLDSEKIYEGITPFSNLLIILFFMLIITVLIFAYFILQYWLIPITKVADSIPDSESTENMIVKINRHLTELSIKTKEAQHIILENKRNSLLKDFYLGKSIPAQDNLPISELNAFDETNYRCICIGSLKESHQHQLDTEYVMEQMKKCSIDGGAYIVIDDILTCLITLSDQYLYANSQAFYTPLNNLLSALNCDTNDPYAIGISDVYNGTACIPSAYHEARRSWQNALLWQNTAVVFNTSLSQYASNYFVNYTMLEAMYQAIITHHQDTALDIFDQLVTDNFNNSKIGRQRALYCQQFTSDILGVLVRISTEYDIHAVIESYLSHNKPLSLNKRIVLLRDAIIESCEFIPVHEYDKDLMNAIFEYCEKHYNEYQLSLSLLADQFHLSKSSISKYFKANSGINFSTYIEKLRIQHAEKLILENKLSVREIAEQVGYQNITTFYNAFRKVNKCTPTEWRQQKIIQMQNTF